MFAAVSACVLTCILWAIVTLVATQRRAPMWQAPAWIAAAISGPAMATSVSGIFVLSFMRVITASAPQNEMAMLAGGVLAGLHPMIFVLWLGALIQFVTIVLAYRALRVEAPGGRGGWGQVVVAIMILAAFSIAIAMHHAAMASIIRGAGPTHIHSQWILATAVSACAVVASVIVAVIFSVVTREHPPAPAASRALFLLVVITFLAIVASALWLREPSHVLTTIANTRRVP
jgi:hypothetical protein